MSGGERDEVATGKRPEAGWAALASGGWEEALGCFQAVLAEGESAEALEGLSWAAWWLNDGDVVFDARERAFGLYRSQGDRRGAARMAGWLATDHVDFRGELAVSAGWLARGRRLLNGVEPCAEHGWLDVHEAEKLLYANDTPGALTLAQSATELGRRLGDIDLEMMGLATEGLVLVTEGAVEEGMARLDEAAAAALGGEFAQIFPIAWCCCYMIYACERARDYDRAAQWCRKVEEWTARMRIEFLNRTCRAHYAGVLIWSGLWEKAEAELAETEAGMAAARPPVAAEVAVRMAELRRRQGRLEEAAAAFEQVREHPLALLGLAEVCLDRGDATAARDRAEEYLREVPERARTVRAAGLELLVRARAALGDAAAAATAFEELQRVAEAVPTDPLRAAAGFSAGVVGQARGDAERCRTSFEDAARLFQRSGAPFEAARARLELAAALAELDRPRDARREASAAATSLQRIGAAREAERAEALARRLGSDPTGSPDSPLTKREQEVLRLVARGMSNREIAAELVLSEHTVHRHVANILAKLGCASRSAAVAESVGKGLI